MKIGQAATHRPETRFIQDLTEMNDDDDDGASDFTASLAITAFSELVLYPWNTLHRLSKPDHDKLIFHGNQMSEMTHYTNVQSSDLQTTSGGYCRLAIWSTYGSYCYTIEIGTAFIKSQENQSYCS